MNETSSNVVDQNFETMESGEKCRKQLTNEMTENPNEDDEKNENGDRNAKNDCGDDKKYEDDDNAKNDFGDNKKAVDGDNAKNNCSDDKKCEDDENAKNDCGDDAKNDYGDDKKDVDDNNAKNDSYGKENVDLNLGSTENCGNEKEEEKLEESNKKEDIWTFVLGHELLKKRVIEEGEDIMTRPVNGQIVNIRYTGCIYEGDGTVVDSNDSLAFTLGDGDVIMAFDLCVALMTNGEVCEIVTDGKYAFGIHGRKPDIPPNASLQYEIKLLGVSDAREPAKMSAEERNTAANEKRERGNSLYTQGEYGSAINSYTKALTIVDIQHDVNVEDKADLKLLETIRMKCYNNLAAAQLKVEAWDAAIKSSDQVLRVQPDNVKALFRKGKCLAGKREFTSAIDVLREALKLEPETKIIHQELARLVAKQKNDEMTTREMYKRMWGNDTDTAEQPTSKSLMKRGTWLAIGGATVAALVSVGIGIYRHLHL